MAPMKPQQQYNIIVDNTNKQYEHPEFLYRSQDGSRVIHPAEYYNPIGFVFQPPPIATQPVKPPPLEVTPYKLIEDANGLNYLASKLRGVEEFAVDLEHHGFRSFQGITCLMQISTRSEDFLIDTLNLRHNLKDSLGEFFMDCSKRKIMHGACNDIIWLQRDFGIYVVNLFDTMQASQVLKTERNTLGFILKQLCDVDITKVYGSKSNWLMRPLPADMIKYAREDTHYLFYLHDMIRVQLASKEAPLKFGCVDPLAEVYKKSHAVCMKLYQKQIFDREISYLYLYGLERAGLEAYQLAIIAGLYEWRDMVARREDESTGYVMPNEVLMKIAKASPLPTNKKELLDTMGYSREFCVKDADLLFQIIRLSVQFRTHQFVEIAEDLRNGVVISEIVAKINHKRQSGCPYGRVSESQNGVRVPSAYGAVRVQVPVQLPRYCAPIRVPFQLVPMHRPVVFMPPPLLCGGNF